MNDKFQTGHIGWSPDYDSNKPRGRAVDVPRIVRLVLPRPAWMQGGEDCDWHEDREHENGQYINKCCQCGSDFIGHKRRPACRRCYTQEKARYDAMTPEERADHDAKVAAEIAKLYETNTLL